jgi:transposase-like protein
MARRLSEVERSKWVARWRASGQSSERFAPAHGLSPSTLYRWSQRAGQEKARPSFAEVRVVGAVGAAPLKIAHPSGCVVRVRGGVDVAQLAAVLRALAC